MRKIIFFGLTLGFVLSACGTPSNLYVRKTPNTTPEMREHHAGKNKSESFLPTTKTINSSDSVPDSNLIHLKEGQNKFLGDTQTNITFKKVIEDSRCPENTPCQQTGEAIVEVEFIQITSRPITIRLTTHQTQNRNNLKNTVRIGNYTYTLKSISPNTSSQQNAGKYQIALAWN